MTVPNWLTTYPPGVPAEIDPTQYRSLVALMEEAFAKYAKNFTSEGLAKSDGASIRAAYEAGRHAFQPTPTGWQARNPGQQWTTTFDRRGFVATPNTGGWTWGLELQGYGFGAHQQTIAGTPAVQAAIHAKAPTAPSRA